MCTPPVFPHALNVQLPSADFPTPTVHTFPSYSYLVEISLSRLASSADGAGSCCRRLISRYTVMRWRGVSVTSRDGQLLSQNPHSMHL